MSHSASYTKIIYDPSRLKTPNIKAMPPSLELKEDETGNSHGILMDEFGQTPDHFYLARKPPSFFQVKRKLNLQRSQTSEDYIQKPTRRRRKLDTKPKVKKVSKARYDTSLGQLTKKFLKLLSDASDGIINLNTACSLLSVPKRRLYDITNVLEGAGLIQKTSRNNIKWNGEVSSSSCADIVYDLEKEIDILEAKENKLDELIYHMKSEIRALKKESEGNYLYITSDELKNIEDFSTKTFLGIKLASGEQIIEPSERKVLVTSKTTELEAFLVSEDNSIVNILHPQVEFKENSYKVQILNNHVANLVKEEPVELNENCYGFENDSTFAQLCSEAVWSEGFMSGSAYSRLGSGTAWNDRDIKNAFITDEDDIAPMSKNFLLQTEDQDLDLPFPNLEFEDNYSFSLGDGEGISDLYDCKFPCP